MFFHGIQSFKYGKDAVQLVSTLLLIGYGNKLIMQCCSIIYTILQIEAKILMSAYQVVLAIVL
jgi:hypothetical protein